MISIMVRIFNQSLSYCILAILNNSWLRDLQSEYRDTYLLHFSLSASLSYFQWLRTSLYTTFLVKLIGLLSIFFMANVIIFGDLTNLIDTEFQSHQITPIWIIFIDHQFQWNTDTCTRTHVYTKTDSPIQSHSLAF